MRTTLYLLVACLFSACSTIEYIGIETYNPAEITFPKKVDKVLQSVVQMMSLFSRFHRK